MNGQQNHQPKKDGVVHIHQKTDSQNLKEGKNAINDYSNAIQKSVRQMLMTHEKYGRKLDRKLYKEVDKLLEDKVVRDYHVKLGKIIIEASSK